MNIKICGITNVNDALLAEALGADFIGFNFSRHSPRCIDLATAKRICQALTSAQPIGIFIEHTTDIIQSYCDALSLYAAQIYQQSMITLQNCKIIYPILVDASASTLQKIPETPPISADYFLYDTKHPQQFGGTGKRFNWGILPKDKSRLWIAGGINSQNVRELIPLDPFAIDVCSGVESSPGRKCPQQLQQLFKEISAC
ncbi:MAG: phosphoribosylanthranilate isomerase [Legionellales bacterium]|nr:phosphoribosylanthranilate isomerase [Legionellales bacterium]